MFNIPVARAIIFFPVDTMIQFVFPFSIVFALFFSGVEATGQVQINDGGEEGGVVEVASTTFFPGEDLRFAPNRAVPYLKIINQKAEHVTTMNRTLEDGRVTFRFSSERSGETKVTVYDSDTFRVQWHWTRAYPKDEPAVGGADVVKLDELPIESGDTPDYFWIRTTLIEARISKKGDLSVDFHCAKTGEIVCRDVSVEYNPSYDAREDSTYDGGIREDVKSPLAFKIKNSKMMDKNTVILGLGDWAGPINRRGHKIQFWNEDAFAWGEYQSPKYTSFPVMYAITPREGKNALVYGLFFNNPSRTMFDLGVDHADIYSFEAADGQIDYFFFYNGRGDLAGLIDSLTSVTGRSAMLPKWGYGYHMSRFSYTQADMQEVLDNFVFDNTPLSSIFLDLDYMDQTSDPTDKDWSLVQFKWNPSGFPSPKEIVRKLGARGVETTVIVEPFLDFDDDKFDFAVKAGFLVKNIRGEVQTHSIWCAEKMAWIDFTNGEAREWWKNELAHFLKTYGIKGVWNDLNETADVGRIPLDAGYRLDGKFPDPFDSRRWHLNVKSTHCIYGTKVSYDAILKAWPGERPFVLGRGGFPGVQRWSAGWSGDNVADRDHLRHNIRSGVSVAICGWSNYGHDVGGFTGHPSFRVLQRWHEWSAFTPLMRNHSGKGDPRRDPFLYLGEEGRLLGRAIRSRYYFLPHLYSLAYQCTVGGWPMNAPVGAVFPNEKESYYLNEYDFMVGRDVLVAPVVFEGDTSRKVRFPKGSPPTRWHSFRDDKIYNGGERAEVTAPLGTVPLFVRDGGMIAVNPEAWTMKSPNPDNTEFRKTEFHFWGGPGHYFFYDDGGTSMLSETDPKRVQMSFRTVSFGDNLVIKAQVDGMVEGREYKLVIRGERFLESDIYVDGKKVEGEEVRGSKNRGETWRGRSFDLDFAGTRGRVILVTPTQ